MLMVISFESDVTLINLSLQILRKKVVKFVMYVALLKLKTTKPMTFPNLILSLKQRTLASSLQYTMHLLILKYKFISLMIKIQ